MSNEQLSVAEISRQLKRDKDTIYSLINKYNFKGIEGLKNKPGQGPKAALGNLSTHQKKTLKQAVDAEPQNLNKVSALLSQKFGFRVSKWMLIRYLKKK